METVLIGDTFDDSSCKAMACCEEEGRTFIHPFDDEMVIAGQGTAAVEILNDCDEKIDLCIWSYWWRRINVRFIILF